MTVTPPAAPVPPPSGQRPPARLNAAWSWLTAPSARLLQPDQRRQAQLLASLLIIIIPLLLLTETIVLILVGRGALDGFVLSLAVAVGLAAAYALSRTAHFLWAALLTCVIGALGVFAFGFSTPPAVFVGVLSWLLIPLLLASAFLPIRQLLWFWLACLAGLLLFPRFVPVVTLTALALNSLPFVVMAGAVVLVLTRHRDHLERDRAGSLQRADLRAQQEAARTAALLRVAERLNASLDLETVLAAMVAEIALALAAEAAIVFLYDDAPAVLSPAASHGLPPGAPPGALPAASIARAVHDQVVAALGPVAAVPAGLSLPGFPDASAFGLLAADPVAYATLVYEGQLVGSLFVIRRALKRPITADERLLLRGLADQSALAIVNTRLYKDARQRLDRLQALRTVDIAISSNRDIQVILDVLLEQITRQLGVDAALVLLLDASQQRLVYAAGRGFHTQALRSTRLRLGDGRAGQVALQRRSLAVPDLAADLAGFAYAPLILAEGFASYFAAPLVAKDKVYGVLELFHRTRLAPNAEWLDFLDALAGQAAIAIDNSTLLSDLQNSNANLALAYDATIEGWSHALDLRDHETEGHTQRVTEVSLALARRLGRLDAAELVHMRRGALLHDIGKMGVPDSILLKPGPLTADEWAVMRRHPTLAYEMLLPIEYLRPALDIPYAHHEKWDGTGYPLGLQGEQIPLAARLFAVVDIWDALRSDRPYRPAWPEAKVRAHLAGLAGTHLDPDLVAVFLQLLERPAPPAAVAPVTLPPAAQPPTNPPR